MLATEKQNIETVALAFQPIPVNSPTVWTEMPRKDLISIPAATRVGKHGLALACSIFVMVDWNKDGVLISSELLEEDGYGKSYEEALEDFLKSLRDKRTSLEKRESLLSSGDARVLRLLRDSLTP